MRSLKPSFSFLENPFAIDVVGNGCPVSSPITEDTAAAELELLELQQEDEGLRERTQTMWRFYHGILRKCSSRKIPTNKRVC